MTTVAGAAALARYAPRLAGEWRAARDHDQLTVDGAVLSLDLRGFTDLTRRLSARARHGAEEVTALIAERFAPLVDAVEARGGDVIAFGGDALLVLFTGDMAGAAAASTALALRDLVTRAGRATTSIGSVRLSARIGVAAGPVDCYRIGSRQRAIAIAGPVVSAALARERAARSGEVVAGADLVGARLGAVCGGGRVLRDAPPVTTPVVQQARTRSRAADGYVAPALRAWLRAGVGTGEHRALAVGFVALTGLDRMRATGGAVAVAAALQRLAAAVERAADDHDLRWINTDAQRDGVKLTLVAGLPAVAAGDEGRLLRGLVDAVGSLADLRVHAGAAAGRAFVGDVGGAHRRGLLVMGDAVNLAARLAGRTRGQVLADPAIVAGARDLDVAPIASFRARGFREPVRAYRVTGQRPDDALDERPRGRFVGRRRELARFRALVEAARQGRGATIELVAEPGAGKSRLLTEIATIAPPGSVVMVSGSVAVRAPFGSVRAPLTARLGTRASRDLAPVLGAASSTGDAMTERDRRRVHAAVAAALDDGRPLVLLVDDAQWLDEASRALLQTLAEYGERRGWLIVVARRADGVPFLARAERGHRMRLGPLDAASVREIVLRSTARTIGSDELDRIVRAARGNPLFAGELASAPTPGVALRDLPDRIERVIAARIDLLAPERRARLRDASVFGREVSLALFDAVVGKDREGGSGLGAFVTVDGGVLRFRHELVREAAYEGLSFRRRRELHAKTVRALARPGSDPLDRETIAALAYHAAGSGEPTLAWRWCRRGGDAALAGGAFGDAVAHYGAALAAARTAPPSARALLATWERCGDAADRAGLHEHADAAYRRARALAADPRRRALLASKLGVLAERAGRFPVARRWYRTGLREVAGAPAGAATDLATARLLLDLGSACQYEGRLGLAARHARDAAALAQRRADRALVGQAEMQLEMVYGALGDPESEVHFTRAERALRAAHDDESLAALYLSAGLTAYDAGDWDRAEARYAAALTALERGGHPGARATARNNQAMLLLDRGRYAEARTLVETVRRDFESLGFELGAAVTTMSLARIAALTGDAAAAAAGFRAVRRALRALGSTAYDGELAVYDVERLVAARDFDAARRRIAPARERLGVDRPALAVTLQRLAGEALAGSGRHDRGIAALTDALARARELDARAEIAYGLDALCHHSRARSREWRAERDELAAALGIVRFSFRATARAPRAGRRRAR